MPFFSCPFLQHLGIDEAPLRSGLAGNCEALGARAPSSKPLTSYG